MKQKTRISAFTLVEMAVVLVIIGLITGGIFVGTTVVRNAEIQTIVSDYTKYSAAANQFTLQYGNPPGDLADATNYWGDSPTYCSDPTVTDGNPGTCNGDGDGVIAGQNREVEVAWQHLQLAKLITGSNFTAVYSLPPVPGTNMPRGRLEGSGWLFFNNTTMAGTGSFWFNQDLGNMLSIGRVTSLGGAYWIGGRALLTTSEAWKIDAKMDDGLPATGRVISPKTGLNPYCATSAVDASALYNVTYGDKACGLYMLLSTK